MTIEYPLFQNVGRLKDIFNSIQTAEKPAKFTQDFLEKLGYSSSNDRAFAPLLRKMGFIGDGGIPVSPFYDLLRDSTQQRAVLAERIRATYSDIFAINTNIHAASDDDIKGAIARVTGKDATASDRLAKTFKALCALADFSVKRENPVDKVATSSPEAIGSETADHEVEAIHKGRSRPLAFQYNFQIVLPVTTDISVYNAIFKSMREHLDK